MTEKELEIFYDLAIKNFVHYTSAEMDLSLSNSSIKFITINQWRRAKWNQSVDQATLISTFLKGFLNKNKVHWKVDFNTDEILKVLKIFLSLHLHKKKENIPDTLLDDINLSTLSENKDYLTYISLNPSSLKGRQIDYNSSWLLFQLKNNISNTSKSRKNVNWKAVKTIAMVFQITLNRRVSMKEQISIVTKTSESASLAKRVNLLTSFCEEKSLNINFQELINTTPYF